jgi:plasmid stabilization system protein ParE
VGKPFIITPQAQRDFDKTYWWYEEQYQGLGKEFARCVDAKIAEIQRFPEQFQIIYKDNVRRALVSRFPYSVFFVNKSEVLSIFAIQRQSRNPDLWKSRV